MQRPLKSGKNKLNIGNPRRLLVGQQWRECQASRISEYCEGINNHKMGRTE
jgi:hypothetical protein